LVCHLIARLIGLRALVETAIDRNRQLERPLDDAGTLCEAERQGALAVVSQLEVVEADAVDTIAAVLAGLSVEALLAGWTRDAVAAIAAGQSILSVEAFLARRTGRTLWALLSAFALFADGTLWARSADSAGGTLRTLVTGIALVALLPDLAAFAFLADGTLWAESTGSAFLAGRPDRASWANLSLDALGAYWTLRSGIADVALLSALAPRADVALLASRSDLPAQADITLLADWAGRSPKIGKLLLKIRDLLSERLDFAVECVQYDLGESVKLERHGASSGLA
jgi:hypothetical protein